MIHYLSERKGLGKAYIRLVVEGKFLSCVQRVTELFHVSLCSPIPVDWERLKTTTTFTGCYGGMVGELDDRSHQTTDVVGHPECLRLFHLPVTPNPPTL